MAEDLISVVNVERYRGIFVRVTPDLVTHGQAYIARLVSTRQHKACATTKTTRSIPAGSVRG